MAYEFNNEPTASFKYQQEGNAKFQTIKGINSSETSAQVICDGVASLLSIGAVIGVYDNASRVVTENVEYQDN